MKQSIVSLVILLAAACGSVDNPPPDPEAPDAMTGEPVSCTPDTFLACDDAQTARSCNATGDGFVTADCGVPGCNSIAGRCNECAPATAACDGDVLEQCDGDGLALPAVACAHTCTTAPAAHCAYLQPKYMPDVCDTPATEDVFAVGTNATFDTSIETNCTGGVITQTGGPPICVIRARSISITATLTVDGFRAIAFVADDDVEIGTSGVLDIAADGTTSGPGGGLVTSGQIATTQRGGGGAGFNQSGASGGNSSTDGGGGLGGGTFDPLAVTALIGGGKPAGPSGPVAFGVFGGGGGGAAVLTSCHGSVRVAGTIDAGGGGGEGGFDSIAGPQLEPYGGAGGGSGGYVVLEGLDVVVTGRLFANGGGGGGGAGNDVGGNDGIDGRRSATMRAAGGNPVNSTGTGGQGGIGAGAPTVGIHGTSAGGGGGGTGRFQVFTPDGVSPTLAPAEISPPFEPNVDATTR